MANRIIKFVEKVGFTTLDSAALARRMLAEAGLALREQEEAVKSILQKREKEQEEKRRELEKRLEAIRESVVATIEEESPPAVIEIEEREELKVPLSTRIANIIADAFSAYVKAPQSFFGDIQENLYKANILMPARKYIAIAFGVAVITGIFISIISTVLLSTFFGVGFGIVGMLLGIPVFAIVLIFARSYPKSKVKARSDAFSRELPYALRHMATQLASGSGLLETFRSLSVSEYGVLSEEFKKAILEIDRGATIEEALERMNLRIDSPALKKATRQIISTLKTGGNLADTLKIIADETEIEMRMKLKDFIQTLNTFSLMYMFITVVAPVLITTLVIAMGIALKGLPMPVDAIWLLYIAFFGIAVYLSFMVKRFEPKV